MSKGDHKKTLILLGILILTLLLSTQSQGATELIIEPARFELLLSPGNTETQALTITNNGTETVRIGVDVRDWEMDEEGNPLFTIPGQSLNSCAHWLRFNPRLFQLGPGAQQVVRFSITTPSQVSAGEHRCAILFGCEPVGTEAEFSMVSNILVTVYGYTPPVFRRGSLDEIVIDYIQETGVQIKAKITSTGNSHLRFTGGFRVIDKNNKICGDGMYTGNVVFPGNHRILTGTLPLELPPGDYRVESQFYFTPPLYAGDLAEYEIEDENFAGFKNTTAFTVDAE